MFLAACSIEPDEDLGEAKADAGIPCPELKGETCSIGQRCDFFFDECCCGQCFAREQCSCVAGEWACAPSHACHNASPTCIEDAGPKRDLGVLIGSDF